MKILHVIPSYEPAWAFGGTVTATSNLCRALARKGIDVTVYTTDADGKGGHLDVPLNEPDDLGGVKVWYFKCDLGVRKAFYSRGLARKLKETIQEFDVVDVSAIWQWIQVNVYKTCKFFNKPYIVTAHGSFNPWPWNESIFKKRIYWHLFSKKTVANAEAIHFTAEEERTKSLNTVPMLKGKESFIIPNGLTIKNNFNWKNIREQLSIPDEKFLLLYTGRVHKIKGIHFVINAMKMLNNNNFVICIVGNKEDKRYVQYLKSLSIGLNNKIVWHDEVPKNEIWDFYHSADLYVAPSYDENFGFSIVEAMSCGLPVMVSKNVCIWKEITEDNAGVAVDLDSSQIAEILRKCLENPGLLKQLSHNARKSAEKRYDINKVADLMIMAYEDVLTGRRSPELKWQ